MNAPPHPVPAGPQPADNRYEAGAMQEEEIVREVEDVREVEAIDGEEEVINFGAQMPMFQQKLLGPDDPERMFLSQEEIQWALDIKELAEKMPELDKLTDFQIAQLALLEHGNKEAALKRAVHLQLFREEYGAIETYQAGRRALETFIKRFPKHWLSFSFNKNDGNYVFVYDMKGMDQKMLDNPGIFEESMTACYYVGNCLTPDMTSIRRGSVLMAECDGYDFTKNLNSKTNKRYWAELAGPYPIRFHKMKHFNSGLFVNILYSMTKRILPSYIREVFEVGNHLDDGRTLDQIFLVPTVEASNQRLVDRLTAALKRRYDHENMFTLDGLLQTETS